MRDFAQRWRAQAPRLDVLVNNAGVLPAERSLSADGIELTFAVNVLAPFLLTKLLLGSSRPALLRGSSPSPPVACTRSGSRPTIFRAARRLHGATAYARTKRARGDPDRVVGAAPAAAAASPSTPCTRDGPTPPACAPRCRASPRRWLRCCEPPSRAPTRSSGSGRRPSRPSSGAFWHDRRPRPVHLLPRTRESPADRERLWRECERLTGTEADG